MKRILQLILSVTVVILILPSLARAEAPVVFLVLDEFPTTSLLNSKGEIHQKRFPNFYALSKEASWYKNNTTVADSTPYALSALLTGNKPKKGSLPTWEDYPNNFFTFLGQKGYKFHNGELITQMCPRSLCPSVKRVSPESASGPMDFLKKKLALRTRGKGLRDRHIWTENFIEKMSFSKRKTAVFLHLLIPHSPFRYLPGGKYYTAPRGLSKMVDQGEAIPKDNPWKIRSFHHRGMLQIGYADYLLGKIIKKMKAEKVWDSATFVVSGDHGASFMPGARRRAADLRNKYDIALTPLFIKTKGAAKGTQNSLTTSLDVLPTISSSLDYTLYQNQGYQNILSIPPDRRRRILSSLGGSIGIGNERANKYMLSFSSNFNSYFGEGDLFSLGPDSNLIGQRVFIRKPRKRLVQFRYQNNYSGLKVDAMQVGIVSKKVPLGSNLLLAIDGRVVSSSEVMISRGKRTVVFMVKPKTLRGSSPAIYRVKRGKVTARLW